MAEAMVQDWSGTVNIRTTTTKADGTEERKTRRTKWKNGRKLRISRNIRKCFSQWCETDELSQVYRPGQPPSPVRLIEIRAEMAATLRHLRREARSVAILVLASGRVSRGADGRMVVAMGAGREVLEALGQTLQTAFGPKDRVVDVWMLDHLIRVYLEAQFRAASRGVDGR
jgi:hypothetical protein